MLEDYFEEEVEEKKKEKEEEDKKEEEEEEKTKKKEEEQQLKASAEVTITKSGQRNHQPTCSLYSSRGQRKGTVYKWARCDMGLCVVPSFAEYHTNVNL
jgi:hypothetical protein